jgi:hypothetical protein
VFNATKATAGVPIAVDTQTPVDNDIAKITLKLDGAGLDLTNDQLLLDVAHVLNADFTVTNTIGVVVVDYTYTVADKTLVITKHDKTNFLNTTVPTLVNAIQLKTASTQDGDRTLTVSYTDHAGNTGTSATSTLTLDTTAPDISLSVSTVGTDGSKAQPNGSVAPYHNYTDKFITLDEASIVLKVDSITPSNAKALKKGDVVKLQYWDDATGEYVDLLHSDRTVYTYPVTQDDTSAADGLGKAVYFEVQKTDLNPDYPNAFVTKTVRACVTDLAGNTSYANTELITVAGKVTLFNEDMTTGSGVTQLEVTSPIVLHSTRALSTGVLGKFIHITNKSNTDGTGGTHDKQGYLGESTEHTQDIDASDTRFVQVVGDKIIITPPFDLDFSNNYEITVDDGAFKTLADTSTGVLSQPTEGLSTPLAFSTVDVGTDKASAVQGQCYNTTATDASFGTLVNGKKWFSVNDATSVTPANVDLAGDDYAMVFKDQDPEGLAAHINDGTASSNDLVVNATSFGSGDIIYADDQNNKLTALNNSRLTQIVDSGVPNQLTVRFDPVDSPTDPYNGGIFNLNTALTVADLTASNQILISNTHSATAITAIDRVNASGTVLSGTVGPTTVTSSQPMHVKVTATVKAGDKVQLKYVDDDGTSKNLGPVYTATTADVGHGYVTIDVPLDDLKKLPQQQGYDQIYAQLTNDTGAVSNSHLLGGDNGLYVDFVSTTPIVAIKSGQDATVTYDETGGVDLQVYATTLDEVIVLRNNAGTAIGTPHTVTEAEVGTQIMFNVPLNMLIEGPNTITVYSTDAGSLTGSYPIIITRTQYVDYTGTVGLGPVVAGNNLKVTAYKADGTELSHSNVADDGTYTIKIDNTYKGAVTLRVSNDTSRTAANDYLDESTGAPKDIGPNASIASVVVADGAAKSVNISALTDLVARTLVDAANKTAATPEQISAYNTKLSELLGLTKAGITSADITTLGVTFAINKSDSTFNSAGGLYGQLLAQISDQAVAKATNLDDIQTQLASAINWGWDATAKTASPSFTRDIGKQVVLLTKVAQAAALSTGSTSGGDYLSAADFSNAGFSSVAGLTSARLTDLIKRIVASTNDASSYDTMAELQPLVDKVVALAKIQRPISPQQASQASIQPT